MCGFDDHCKKCCDFQVCLGMTRDRVGIFVGRRFSIPECFCSNTGVY